MGNVTGACGTGSMAIRWRSKPMSRSSNAVCPRRGSRGTWPVARAPRPRSQTAAPRGLAAGGRLLGGLARTCAFGQGHTCARQVMSGRGSAAAGLSCVGLPCRRLQGGAAAGKPRAGTDSQPGGCAPQHASRAGFEAPAPCLGMLAADVAEQPGSRVAARGARMAAGAPALLGVLAGTALGQAAAVAVGSCVARGLAGSEHRLWGTRGPAGPCPDVCLGPGAVEGQRSQGPQLGTEFSFRTELQQRW
mmetsp:Transcript_63252/g.179914  ORF Transcript_63252/g.179914 Transcript_63252/m.179914 type:complete len:247 (-) Transcript_63252:2017-2757(-)